MPVRSKDIHNIIISYSDEENTTYHSSFITLFSLSLNISKRRYPNAAPHRMLMKGFEVMAQVPLTHPMK